MKLLISKRVRDKLNKTHKVSESEISQCISNRDSDLLKDEREEHQSNPETLWFISETNQGRRLKIVLIINEGSIEIKSAYEPSKETSNFYYRKLKNRH